ncbi:hypothetical protein [Marispirochaeta aestuarii]|uniref:hypothetical protein n=1 Tax=Marispirochaeta aestuarii TaxID=1963862 RepID=UPI001E62F830|nr:hypothetical protein [Marispirochaeta aestuarii]
MNKVDVISHIFNIFFRLHKEPIYSLGKSFGQNRDFLPDIIAVDSICGDESGEGNQKRQDHKTGKIDEYMDFEALT